METVSYQITKVKKENDDIIFTPTIDKQIDNVFNTLIEVNEKDIIVRENCKLCKHNLRFEIEKKWEETGYNYSQTTEWINELLKKEKADIPTEELFTIQNIRNHMKNHYAEQERQIRLRDYSKKIEDLVNIKQDKKRLIEIGIAMCFEDLGRIGSAETYGDLKLDKIRSEQIHKIISSIVSLVELQNKLDGELASVQAITERFTRTWINTINKEESEAKKKILLEMLEEFSHNMQKGS